MRILAVTPIRVADHELRRRRERYQRLAPAGVTLELVNLPAGSDTPTQLNSPDDIAASERLTLQVARAADATRWDLVLPDCVLDPGVGAGAGAAEPVPVPVVGILQLCASFLASLGLRFAAVTRNQAIGDELRARIDRYGLERFLSGLEVLDLDFEAISDETRWQDALQPVRERARRDGVPALLNGCSAVEVPADEHGAVVVDPTRLALDLLGVAARSGLLGHVR